MAKLYAHPYSYDHAEHGFYFDSQAEYDEKREALEARGCEEWEIQYIDGDNPKLFETCRISQRNIKQWFDDLDDIEDDSDKALAIMFLMETVRDLDGAIAKADEVNIFKGTRADYAEEYADECGMLEGLPRDLRPYFDFDSLARDWEYNGAITEIEPDVWVTNPQDF